MKHIIILLLSAISSGLFAQSNSVTYDSTSVDLHLPSNHISKASYFGFGSVACSITGIALTVVGTVNKSAPLTYAGSGLTGAGVTLLIPVFINFKNSSTELSSKGL